MAGAGGPGRLLPAQVMMPTKPRIEDRERVGGTGVRRLERTDQWSFFWRSFFLQALWNVRGMQNLGFLFCMMPTLRRLYSGPELVAALERHARFFNTQPYMAGFVLGVTARLEEEHGSDRGAAREAHPKRLEMTKGTMGAALAGIGDSLFWSTLRPLAAGAGLVCAAVLWKASASGGWGMGAAAAVYLAVFNGGALWARWTGVRIGYERCESIAAELQRFKWQGKIRRFRLAGLAVSGALAAWMLLSLSGPRLPGSPGPVGAGAVLLAALGLELRGWPAVRVFWLGLGAAAILRAAGV